MNRKRLGYIGVYLVSCFLTVSLPSFITHAQQVGRNVNMVSGTTLPGGDPYLQRQNEPSGAVSTRNPMHLLVGANDYRTVDLPGVLGAVETGDAWQGVFKSIDGGQSWFSTLLPGYPQDQSAEGLTSPIYGYEAASDPVVRAGTHGMFYYAGMAFDRGESAPSSAFVARYIDLNNKENADPMEYVDTYLIDYRTGFWDSVEPEPEDFRAGFIDKPWLAVDVPRSGAETCSITVEQEDREGIPHTVTQQFPGGRVYVAYTVIKSIGEDLHSTVLFSYSKDCGESWSSPKKLASAGRIFQGATIAINPTSGAVYVSWRQFEQFDPDLNINHPNALFIARSDDGGKKFKKEVQVAAITAFDQPTLPKNALPDFRGFRFNAYPTMTVDGDGRVYIAWSEYGLGAAEDARVVVSTSGDGGQSWSLPIPLDDALMEDDQQGMIPVRCRQVFPSLSLSSGQLMVAYYDFRENILEEDTPLSFIGDFISSPEVEFHHSVDVRVAQAEPGPNPVFTSYPDYPSAQVSRYLWVMGADDIETRKQTQYNKPNLPLFDQGSKPFMGDYVDIIASPPFVQDGNGNWVYNLDADKSGIFHAIWADNRDVRLPTNEDWTAYQPPVSDQPEPFRDPSLADYPNGECDVDLTGMRDQNIYTSQITEGLYVGSPSNTKPLSSEVHRAFVAFVRNATADAKSYRLTVANQPPGGTASFHQFDFVTRLDVTIPAHSSTSRPVFVTSTEETATVHILVQEIYAPEGDIIPPILGGLQGLIELNPDVLNPEILNPEILNPEQTNADINTVEIHNPEILNPEILNPEILNPEILNPEILNPEILNPEILNPEILNPEILNPEILNPEILNPEILNPEILNPEILNPEILNPEILNARLTDITWTVRNDGNTTSSYTAKPFIAQELPEAANFRFQLLIYRIHATPAVNAITCELETEPLRQRQHHELIVDIRNPEILNPEILNPEILNYDPDVATFYAAPGETVRVTLRMLDPDITDEYDLNTDAVALATISHAVDSDDANNVTQPDVVVQTSTGVPIDILTTVLPDATTGSPYSATLVAAGGIPPLTWSEQSSVLGVVGTPCEWLALDSSGVMTGTPVNSGTCGPFTVQVTDGSLHVDTQVLTILVRAEEWAAHYDEGIGFDRAWDIAVDAAGNVYVTGGSDIGINYQGLGVTVKYDSSGNEQWSRSFHGEATDIALDSAGNVYVTGPSRLPAPYGFMTVKYDALGNELWAEIYEGLYNRPADIAVDTSGNVFVVGITRSLGTEDFATVKYDSNGNEEWTRVWDGTGSRDSAISVAVDSSGNSFVAGYTSDASNNYDFATIKYDSDGNLEWSVTYDGTANDNDVARDIAVNDSGDVYVTGESRDLGSSYHDYATVKYNGSTGSQLWVQRYNGPSNRNDAPRRIALDVAGNVFVTGSSYGSGNNFDYATVKYNSSGGEVWVQRYNGPANKSDEAVGLAVNASGHVYVTGWSNNVTDRESVTIKYTAAGNQEWVFTYNSPGDIQDYSNAIALDSSGNVHLAGFRTTPDLDGDYLTVKCNNDGTFLWNSIYNGVGIDRAVNLAVDGAGDVYVTGHSLNGSYNDFATVKYESSGEEMWARRYNGLGNRDDYPSAIAVDPSGDVVVTGYSHYDGIPRQNYTTVKYDSNGNELWVSAYNGPDNGADEAAAVAIDVTGNIFVTGRSVGSAGLDFATVQYDSGGAEIWATRYNGPANGTDEAKAVALDGDGNIYVAGNSWNGTDYDYATVKYDTDGNELWVATFDSGAGKDQVSAMAVDSLGNVVVTGYSGNNQTTNDYATVMYDGDGNELWSRTYNGPANHFDRAFAIIADSSGNTYVTGRSRGLSDDFATVKYDNSGNQLWVSRYSRTLSSHEESRSISLDTSGNIIVVGWSWADGTSDFAIVKYDSLGNEIWSKFYDGPAGKDDRAAAGAVDLDGNVYVTGYSYNGKDDTFTTIRYRR